MAQTITQKTPSMQRCINECQDCHATCLETLEQCLAMGGKHAEARHITLLIDCAQICATSADYMLRGSELHAQVCRACAEVCQRCAEDCDRFTEGFMKECAEACRRCAASCREMAGMAHAA